MKGSNNNNKPLDAAQEAIAKVNAMLIAKGKLKPSQLGGSNTKKTGSQNNIFTREVEINDVPIGCRNLLTRGATQEEISKSSGASVATKGRYMTQEDRARNPRERPLYLNVQGNSQDAVNLAVGKINDIIANGLAKQGPRMSRFSQGGGNGPRHSHTQGQPRMTSPRQQLGSNVPSTPPPTIQLLEEKLYIGLEHAPPNFSVKDKILGAGCSFLQHIQAETGAKVTLRGKRSGFLEPATGQEVMEPMHVHLQHVSHVGLKQARDLATNLIQTVQQEYASFQQSLVMIPPPNMVPQPPPMTVPPPTVVSMSMAQPPPFLPGHQAMTSMPPPTMMHQPPPLQSTYSYITQGPGVGLPAPGVVIPQLATSQSPGHMMQPPIQTFAPPSSQPLQLVHSSDQQQFMGGQPPQQVFVSAGGPGQPGTMVLTTVQPHMQQPQLLPPGGIQYQQPGPAPPMGAMPQTLIHHAPPGSMPQTLVSAPPGMQHQGVPVQVSYQSQHQQIMAPPGMVSTQQFIPHTVYQTSIPQTSVTVIQPGPSPQPYQLPPPGHLEPQPMGSPQQIVQQPPPASSPWGGPVVSYASASGAPILTHQPPPHSSVVYSLPQYSQPQYSQSGEYTYSTAQPQSVAMVTSSSAPLVTSASSNYVYKPGPIEEPRRRFTEERDDKLPEGLLGYEHGPPHLTNLMVQAGQQHNQSPSHHQGTSLMSKPPQLSEPVYTEQIVQGQPVLVETAPQYVYSASPGHQPLMVSQQPGPPQPGPPQPYTTIQPPVQQPRYIQQQQPPPQMMHQVQVQQGQYHHQQQQQFYHQQQQQQEFQQPQRIVQQAVQELPRPESETDAQPPYLGQMSNSGSEHAHMPPYPAQVSSSGADHTHMPPYLGQLPSSGTDSTHMPPFPGQGSSSGADYANMPPPPPPSVAGMKRTSPGLSPLAAPEPRKKSKGPQEDEDEDQDVPSSMASQVKEVRKYSFNQYSGGPQLYTAPTTGGLTQYGNGGPGSGAGEYAQYGVAQSGLGPEYTGYQEQQYQNQEPQNRYGASPQHSVYSSQAGVNPAFTQFSTVSSATTYSTNVSSPGLTSHLPPPPPPPPLYEDPNNGAGALKGQGFNPKFVQMGSNGREELLSQPPPPPPRPTFW